MVHHIEQQFEHHRTFRAGVRRCPTWDGLSTRKSPGSGVSDHTVPYGKVLLEGASQALRARLRSYCPFGTKYILRAEALIKLALMGLSPGFTQGKVIQTRRALKLKGHPLTRHLNHFPQSPRHFSASRWNPSKVSGNVRLQARSHGILLRTGIICAGYPVGQRSNTNDALVQILPIALTMKHSIDESLEFGVLEQHDRFAVLDLAELDHLECFVQVDLQNFDLFPVAGVPAALGFLR
jgi:hypothetical protein